MAPNPLFYQILQVLRAGMECEPCWFGVRFRTYAAQIHCLQQFSVDTVEHVLRLLLE